MRVDHQAQAGATLIALIHTRQRRVAHHCTRLQVYWVPTERYRYHMWAKRLSVVHTDCPSAAVLLLPLEMAVPRVRVYRRQHQRRRSLVSALNLMRCNLVSLLVLQIMSYFCPYFARILLFLSVLILSIILIIFVNNIVCIVILIFLICLVLILFDDVHYFTFATWLRMYKRKMSIPHDQNSIFILSMYVERIELKKYYRNKKIFLIFNK